MTDPTVERPAAVAVPIKPLFSDAERSALVGFLAGYSGQTRVAYTLDLRQYTSWCASHGLHLFQAKRADIECFARDLEARGRTRATVARRLSTVRGSTGTQSRRTCSIIRRRCTCAGRGWTTSRTRPRWTATRSVRCWSWPGWAPPPGTL